MRWTSTVSGKPHIDAAVDEAAAAVRAALGDADPDLLIAFVSEHHRNDFARVPEMLAARFGAAPLVGCSAGGVIGGGKEIEQSPGFSLTAAVLPGVELIPFHVDGSHVPLSNDVAAWERLLGVAAALEPHFVLLPDPFSVEAEAFLRGLDLAYPRSHKVGGLASGGREPGANALFLGRSVHRAGVVGVALAGDIAVDTIVAQGCRPIGQPMFITKAQRNILWELDGRSAVQVLRDLYEELTPADQELARHSLFLGIVMNEAQQQYGQGDFLIRNIVGLDPQREVLAIGALLQDNSVVQFHLRDAKTSADDLEQLLSQYEPTVRGASPQGALLFSCLGRGLHLYGRPDHDTEAFQRHIGAVPLGGFFCNGEIGPVHGTTFLHGYTSAFGLFRRRG